MNHLARLLDNINIIAKTVDRATRRKRQFLLKREHIELAFDVGGTVLSLFGGKYKAATKVAAVVHQLHQHIKETNDDSDGKTNRERDSDGEHRDRSVQPRPAES